MTFWILVAHWFKCSERLGCEGRGKFSWKYFSTRDFKGYFIECFLVEEEEIIFLLDIYFCFGVSS
jgi:hypothetical protein